MRRHLTTSLCEKAADFIEKGEEERNKFCDLAAQIDVLMLNLPLSRDMHKRHQANELFELLEKHKDSLLKDLQAPIETPPTQYHIAGETMPPQKVSLTDIINTCDAIKNEKRTSLGRGFLAS